MHRLVQIIRFESARKLPKVPKEHPCSNLYGLAFKLEIHIEGEINPETGFVVDFSEIEDSFEPIKKKSAATGTYSSAPSHTERLASRSSRAAW